MFIEGINRNERWHHQCRRARRWLSVRRTRGARQALRLFWQKMSESALLGIFRPSFIDQGDPNFGLEHSPGYRFMEVPVQSI